MTKMEFYYQHRWHLGNHEGNFRITNADQGLETSQFIEETTLSFAKEGDNWSSGFWSFSKA